MAVTPLHEMSLAFIFGRGDLLHQIFREELGEAGQLGFCSRAQQQFLIVVRDGSTGKCERQAPKETTCSGGVGPCLY